MITFCYFRLCCLKPSFRFLTLFCHIKSVNINNQSVEVCYQLRFHEHISHNSMFCDICLSQTFNTYHELFIYTVVIYCFSPDLRFRFEGPQRVQHYKHNKLILMLIYFCCVQRVKILKIIQYLVVLSSTGGLCREKQIQILIYDDFITVFECPFFT